MVRTRFAPSPTGYLHIGGVRTALFNWLFARHHGGQFILRIDDTDVQRNVDEALQPILDAFRWLGIDWDEGPGVGGPYAPYSQSQRADRYRDAVWRLLEHGVAYRDYARPEEIQAEREIAQREKRRFLYSRRWLAETDEQAGRLEAQGRTASVRLKMPREGTCAFRDLVRGDVGFEWALEQDHVIQRADGSFLYSLASTVDDHDFRITHVIRAVEHLSNTPRQIFIARALGYDVPHYAHVPYVAEPGSAEKLSKRKLEKSLKHVDFKKLYDHGVEIAKASGHDPSATTFTPMTVDFYRQVGYLPDAILNYLLLLGWSLDDRTEAFTREEMVEHFSLERVNRSPASFDPLKLWAFQDRYMRAVPIEQKVTLVLPYLQGAGFVTSPAPADVTDTLTRMLQAAGDRIKVAGGHPELLGVLLARRPVPVRRARVRQASAEGRCPGALAQRRKAARGGSRLRRADAGHARARVRGVGGRSHQPDHPPAARRGHRQVGGLRSVRWPRDPRPRPLSGPHQPGPGAFVRPGTDESRRRRPADSGKLRSEGIMVRKR